MHIPYIFSVPSFGDATVWPEYEPETQLMWNFDGGDGAGVIGRGQLGQAILSADASFWNDIIISLSRAEFSDEIRNLFLALLNGLPVTL